MSCLETLAAEKKEIVARYSKKSDVKAAGQLLTTFLPYTILWYLAIVSVSVSYWLTALSILGLSLILLRVFVLMHECGHNSLFATSKYNKIAGFVLGVLCGMPQYVWARNHAFHHATNGNWDEYRGPLATFSLAEFNALSPKQQRMYRLTRNITFAPVGGFLYLAFNPRFTWIKGNIALIGHLVKGKRANPEASLSSIAKGFECRHWETVAEYRHMTGNNLVLLSLWAIMCVAIGPVLFSTVYLISLSLAGAGGIILFAVQHNFEDAWATDKANWNYNRAAVEGTSFLVLPSWLNWLTANIAYHHIHHLSASIPNYNLAECHLANAHHFTKVTRIRLREIPAALRNTIWDVDNNRITAIPSS